jgi:hypothetical protein
MLMNYSFMDDKYDESCSCGTLEVGMGCGWVWVATLVCLSFATLQEGRGRFSEEKSGEARQTAFAGLKGFKVE